MEGHFFIQREGGARAHQRDKAYKEIMITPRDDSGDDDAQ